MRKRIAIAALALIAGAACAQDKPAANADTPAEAPQPPGKALLAAKCFQCHTDAMFRDQRQDRRAWEATLYRMVGRGALWTRDEINAMADYLATDYGPQSPKPSAAR
jgi:mono/diheme cytochrome c family protein